MLERSPTWRVWHLIHRYQKPKKFEAMMRTLHVTQSLKWMRSLHNMWWWVAIAFVLNCSAFAVAVFGPNLGYEAMLIIGWLPRIGILLLCLEFGVRFLGTIAKQQSNGSYDLLLMLPTSRLGIMMDFVRVHRYPFDGRIRGGLAIFLVLNLFTCCFSVYSTGLRTFTSAIEVLSIETMPFWGIVSFIEYVQSFIATVLIALLLSYQPLSGTRQVAFVGWFVVLQIGFALFNFSIAAAGVGLNGAGGVGSSLNIRNVFVWSVFLQPVFAILCRELVNLALWKAVQRRLEA